MKRAGTRSKFKPRAIQLEVLEHRLLYAVDTFEFASGAPSYSEEGFLAGGNSGKGGSSKSTLTTLVITPGTSTLDIYATQQFVVKAYDQRGSLINPTPVIQWTAISGSISSDGLFTAGPTTGIGSVKASSGSISATASVTITSTSNSNAPPVFQTPALEQLVQSLYVDQSIDRNDMMQILRSTGSDSTVTSGELADLRSVAASTYYVIPNYVRSLTRDVVNDNPANLMFQSQTAGNLTSGSTSTLLNNLVDKWFLGADVPQLTSAASTYTVSNGIMYNGGTPSLNDARQGNVGDCYLIASLVSIANKSPQTIKDMFLDNGDGTYGVRFFSTSNTGTRIADFVTVNRKLPTNSSGILSYAGYGLSATSATTVLWIALAEKAYAQWNETGNAGRNGTNSYAGLEGGWMHNVNAQILGYSSTNYWFSSSTQQSLVNALQSGLAVTAGTLSTVSGSNLVASHAYTVKSYDSTNGTFILHNPWGFQHPSPLTWAQLQSNFSLFTSTEPTGSANAPGGGFASVVNLVPAPAVSILQSSLDNNLVLSIHPQNSIGSQIVIEHPAFWNSSPIGGVHTLVGAFAASPYFEVINEDEAKQDDAQSDINRFAVERAIAELMLNSEL